MRRGPRISLIPSGTCCCRWMRLDGRGSFGDWPWATTRTGTRHERKSRYSSMSNWAGRLPRIRMARCRCCSARDLTSADPQTARPSTAVDRTSGSSRTAVANATDRTGYLQRRLWSLGPAVSVYRLRFVQRWLDRSTRPAIPPGVPALPTGHAPAISCAATKVTRPAVFHVDDLLRPGYCPTRGARRRTITETLGRAGRRDRKPRAMAGRRRCHGDELSDHRAITTRGSPATASGGLAERESP